MGVQTVLRFNSILVIFKLAVLVIFIALGLTAINTNNWVILHRTVLVKFMAEKLVSWQELH